ncbi:Uncharacterised protein [Segatella copri]|nr:Uncharacterised protein [Segatella copri]
MVGLQMRMARYSSTMLLLIPACMWQLLPSTDW